MDRFRIYSDADTRTGTALPETIKARAIGPGTLFVRPGTQGSNPEIIVVALFYLGAMVFVIATSNIQIRCH